MLGGTHGIHNGACLTRFAGGGICLADIRKDILRRTADGIYHLRSIAGKVFFHYLKGAVGVLKSLVFHGNTAGIRLVLPCGLIIFSLVTVGFVVVAGIAGEEALKVRRPLETGVNEIRGVGIFSDVGHVVVAGVFINIIKYPLNHAVDKGNVRAGPYRGIDIGLRRSPGKAWVNVYQLGTLVFSVHDMAE